MMVPDITDQTTEVPLRPSLLSSLEAQHLTATPSLWSLTPHSPDAGINSMADAAARLFSLAGKIGQLKACPDLTALQKELITELGLFQETIKPYYSPEQVFVGRYALCATLDDIISHTPWGILGHWEPFNLLTLLTQEPVREEGFFLILERLIRDPSVYIDLMEFMYLCLSLGFRGSYRATEFTNSQLDQIRDALYRHIRAHQGDCSKSLAPFPVKAAPASYTPPGKRFSISLLALTTGSVVLLLFAGLGHWLDLSTDKTHQMLARIETPLLQDSLNV